MIRPGDNVIMKSNTLSCWGIPAGSRGWMEGPGDYGCIRVIFGGTPYNVHASELKVVEKLKKNDVVIVESRNNEGDIGLVVEASPDGYTDIVRVEVPHPSKATTEQRTLPIWEVEVIDHIDEEESVMAQKKLRIGDVVVIKWRCMEGELGIVTGLLNGGYEVTTKGNFSRFTSDELEVIDHIDEEDPTFKIKASLLPEDMERSLDEIMSRKAEDALKEVQHQEDLATFGVTEHPIYGTQRKLRLEHGNTMIRIICKSCNTVLKEIDLTK